MIQDEAVEVAERYLAFYTGRPGTDWTVEARALLEAAAPHMLTERGEWRKGEIGVGVTIAEFLEARIADDEAGAMPGTVIISGGWPAPEVPNCIGVDGRGCERGWKMPMPHGAPSGWWKADHRQSIIKAHELTHITPQQTRVLAECAAKRAIIRYSPDKTLRHLAAVYAAHPDYQKDWAL